MYKVEWKDKAGVSFEEDVMTLNDAMVFAKELGILVTINGGGMEIVGRFGVDAVVNGVCPDGVKYDWNKANRIGRTRRTR
jgi:hypothetical protein